MEKELKKVILPLKADDRKLLKQRADYINQLSAEILTLSNSLRGNLEYTLSDKGDNQKTLFEIPFKAVIFHNQEDKEGYEKGTWVNFNVFDVHTIRVKYSEYKSGDGFTAGGLLKIQFLWNNLLTSRVEKSGTATPYYGNFDDEKLCFAKTFVFQTQEQYESFKEIRNELNVLAQELGLHL